MKFPAFLRRERTSAAAKERQDRAERALAQSLRAVGQLLQKLADAVDAQRLSRAGYVEPNRYLKRVEAEPRPEDER